MSLQYIDLKLKCLLVNDLERERRVNRMDGIQRGIWIVMWVLPFWVHQSEIGNWECTNMLELIFSV